VVLRAERADLRLRLHPSKTHLHRTARGASFVGFPVIGGRIRLRNHSLLRIRQDQAWAACQSWDAHLAHGHTLGWRHRLFAPYPFACGLPAGT
jgi:hypothetical protein